MRVVKDAMVLINLAKTTIIAASCNYFKEVFISKKVFEEAVSAGKAKNMPDAYIIEDLVKNEKIKVEAVKNEKYLKMINEFNIYGGEAESLALYNEKKLDLLISDDDNLRKKKEIFNAKIIGSLAVILKLRQSNNINKNKFMDIIKKMREIGWFSNSVLDKVLLEGEKYD
ncbi:hypothetical protein HYX16_04665 [Candidatus Woesearchaeota archaeon]|nr:hypothetical protein [Candidatus Woesearchaeota archaeon]